MNKSIVSIFSIFLMLSLVSCWHEEVQEAYDNTLEVEQYYKDNPNFFSFKSIDDLPENLQWENGGNLPEYSSPKAKQGGTLRTYISSFPSTLRFVGPDSNGSFRSFILDDNIMSLVSKHPNLDKYHEALATEWAISKDKKTIYFKLDPTATYSDGTEIIADDYFFTFFFMQSKYINAPWYNNWYSTKYTNITKYDDYTISVTIPESKPDPMQIIGGLRPTPSHFYKSLDKNYVQNFQWKFEPTTGPYEVLDSNIKKGHSIVLTKVNDWWAKDKKFFRNRFNPSKINVLVVRDNNKAFEMFKKGSLDMFGLSLPELWYKKSNIPLVEKGYVNKAVFYNDIPRPTFGFYLNTQKPLLDNKNIRIGISYALNFDRVLEFVFHGDYTRMNTMYDGYGKFTNPNIKAREFSVNKALEYFRKAGFIERGDDDDVLINKDGVRLSLTLTTGYSNFKEMFIVLKEEALDSGLELELEILDSITSFKKVMEKNHEIAFLGYGVGTSPYPSFWQMLHSVNANKPQTNNIFNVSNLKLDALIDEYEKTGEIDRMIEISHEIQSIMHDECIFIPGFIIPWYRIGYWRWIQFPEDFDVKKSSTPMDSRLFWIDEDIKKETLEAKSNNKTFDKSILIFDEWKPTP